MTKMPAKRKAATPLAPQSEHIIIDWRVPRGSIRWRYWAVPLAVLSLFIGFIWWSVASSDARKAEIRAENSVTQLAPGIREAWFAAIDQKLGERLVAADGLIEFAEFGGIITWAPAQLVSVNCSPSIGIWLEYGTAELNPELFLLRHDERPSLGSAVGDRSPAARQLVKDVCKYVTSAVLRVSAMR
jgi:hypothetical protein